MYKYNGITLSVILYIMIASTFIVMAYYLNNNIDINIAFIAAILSLLLGYTSYIT